MAVATAKTLIKRHPELNLGHDDVEDSSWAKSLFKRMGFKKRLATTGKIPISKELHEEIQESYLYSIVKKIESNEIPSYLVLNLDQTPSKFVPGCSKTMAAKKSKTVSIAGSTDKRMITATFVITLTGDFLPIQLIYGGKMTKSLPPVKFPSEFHVTANPKHYSNEKESLEMMEQIVFPYVKKEREGLGLSNLQPALLIMDVFKGQMTDAVRELLKENKILIEKVPANLTYLFQLLDVQGGPNGYVKKMMKKKFTRWYADQVDRALEAYTILENIDISLKLSIMKPLHAKWIIEVYDHMTSGDGKPICLKGWEVAGIESAVSQGLEGMAHIDPFHHIDPLSDTQFEIEAPLLHERDMYIQSADEFDSDSEYEDNDGNIFNILQDDMNEDL